ncbi:DUF2007 domain-containing protein [Patiriisocius hiemis]|uniref:DUF2007 domain-containing protein n=1 Tax=Patiriisocius hiemis TaxID=3075604 RepID=A0ABU2Y9W2_9FLAO|nr:DUF2007 domain-containing protein [Constantimarinum sp. W242]MDT0554580.1 DUF2007 domain-containing protein [Constantimarinum sp. W242]
MEKDKTTTRIYTGPAMIAKGLIAHLNEIGISPIERNDNESGITAGFAKGVPGQVMLFVRKDQLEKAQPVIDAYLSGIGE